MKIKYIKKGEKFLNQKPNELCYFYDAIAEQDGIQITLDSNLKIAFIPINEFEDSEQFLFQLRDEIEVLNFHIQKATQNIRRLSEKLLNSKYKK